MMGVFLIANIEENIGHPGSRVDWIIFRLPIGSIFYNFGIKVSVITIMQLRRIELPFYL
jgi:hypothetical protein